MYVPLGISFPPHKAAFQIFPKIWPIPPISGYAATLANWYES